MPHLWLVNIGSGNGLMPGRHQAITWANVDPDLCQHTVSVLYNQSWGDYRQISNISHTNSQNLIVSRLVLQLSLPNPLKPGVKLRMKMLLEQHW